jgi:hypothetical protein
MLVMRVLAAPIAAGTLWDRLDGTAKAVSPIGFAEKAGEFIL